MKNTHPVIIVLGELGDFKCTIEFGVFRTPISAVMGNWYFLIFLFWVEIGVIELIEFGSLL